VYSTVNIISSNAYRIRLGALTNVRAGYAFRSAIPESADGRVLAVQLRDIRDTGEPEWSHVIRTTLPREPSKAEWLKPGDLLFAFRGTRFFAVLLEDVPGPAVAATQFMLLRVKDSSKVLPPFLAWQLNQPPAQAYFKQAAGGTVQRSLRKGAIEALEVAVPTMEFQRSVVELANLARRERAALMESIRIREQQLNGIATTLLAVARPEAGR
jgi:hypothetical protein